MVMNGWGFSDLMAMPMQDLMQFLEETIILHNEKNSANTEA